MLFCYILGEHITEVRDITELHVKHNDHLASCVIHMEKQSIITTCKRYTQKIIYPPINSKNEIKLLWDTPLNNQRYLNILKTAVLRHDYGANVNVIRESSILIRPYTCGYGSGTSSIGMDPYTFVSRKLTHKMEYIATKFHDILLHKKVSEY